MRKVGIGPHRTEEKQAGLPPGAAADGRRREAAGGCRERSHRPSPGRHHGIHHAGGGPRPLRPATPARRRLADGAHSQGRRLRRMPLHRHARGQHGRNRYLPHHQPRLGRGGEALAHPLQARQPGISPVRTHPFPQGGTRIPYEETAVTIEGNGRYHSKGTPVSFKGNERFLVQGTGVSS